MDEATLLDEGGVEAGFASGDLRATAEDAALLDDAVPRLIGVALLVDERLLAL